MADEVDDAEAKASLARLRLFLAPHAPTKEVPQGKAPHASAEPSDALQTADRIESKENPGDDWRGDLSTRAEQLSAAVSEEEREGSQQVSSRQEPVREDLPQSVDISVAEDSEEAATHHAVPAVGAVATVSPLHVLSKEFLRVKYLLQCSLRGVRVHDDVLMWDMKSPPLVEQYEARANGLLELDSWIEVDNLSAAMGEFHSVGCTPVTDELRAMKFTTGAISLDVQHTSAKGRKQLVLCKIAVGRSLAVRTEAEAESTPLPPGYHSYYVCGHGETTGAEVYRHEYILTDALQILPQYLVRFTYNALDAAAAHACALCEQSPATVVCKACDAELCGQCDQQVHSANKLVERHKRMPKRERMESTAEGNGRVRRRSSTPSCASASSVVGAMGDSNQSMPAVVTPSELLSSDPDVSALVAKQLEDAMADCHATCTLHDGKRVEFFCPVCALPVCVNCKMVGDHSMGEKGAHRLLSIRDAYEQSLRDSFKSDPLVDARKSVIDRKLTLIAQWKKAVEANRDHVEAAIRNQCEQALTRLHEEAHKKLRVLDGEALEFTRQQQQIEWLEDCLEEQRSSCSVLDFLSTWSHHKALRAQQRDFPPGFQGSTSGEHVKADLQVVGSLQIVQGDQFEPRQSLTSATNAEPRDDHEPSALCTGSLATIRRSSDNEIRRKLLSMRPVEPTRDALSNVANAGKPFNNAMATLSSQGQKMMEEIRMDLLARGTIRSHANQGNGYGSYTSIATRRTFSLQPARLSQLSSQSMAGLAKQATISAAWTALFRQELAHAKENPPEQ